MAGTITLPANGSTLLTRYASARDDWSAFQESSGDKILLWQTARDLIKRAEADDTGVLPEATELLWDGLYIDWEIEVNGKQATDGSPLAWLDELITETDQLGENRFVRFGRKIDRKRESLEQHSINLCDFIASDVFTDWYTNQADPSQRIRTAYKVTRGLTESRNGRIFVGSLFSNSITNDDPPIDPISLLNPAGGIDSSDKQYLGELAETLLPGLVYDFAASDGSDASIKAMGQAMYGMVHTFGLDGTSLATEVDQLEALNSSNPDEVVNTLMECSEALAGGLGTVLDELNLDDRLPKTVAPMCGIFAVAAEIIAGIEKGDVDESEVALGVSAVATEVVTAMEAAGYLENLSIGSKKILTFIKEILGGMLDLVDVVYSTIDAGYLFGYGDYGAGAGATLQALGAGAGLTATLLSSSLLEGTTAGAWATAAGTGLTPAGWIALAGVAAGVLGAAIYVYTRDSQPMKWMKNMFFGYNWEGYDEDMSDLLDLGFEDPEGASSDLNDPEAMIFKWIYTNRNDGGDSYQKGEPNFARQAAELNSMFTPLGTSVKLHESPEAGMLATALESESWVGDIKLGEYIGSEQFANIDLSHTIYVKSIDWIDSDGHYAPIGPTDYLHRFDMDFPKQNQSMDQLNLYKSAHYDTKKTLKDVSYNANWAPVDGFHGVDKGYQIHVYLGIDDTPSAVDNLFGIPYSRLYPDSWEPYAFLELYSVPEHTKRKLDLYDNLEVEDIPTVVRERPAITVVDD